MTGLRDRIEARFESFAGFLIRRRWLIIAATVVVAALLSAGLLRLTVDFSNEGFLYDDDPIVVRYNEFKAQFGRDDVIIIAIEPDRLFSTEALARIRSLHTEIAGKVPHVKEVLSLVNARNTYGDGDKLIVEDLLRQAPRTEAELTALKARVMANPLYRNQLISADGRVTTLIIELDAYSGGEGDVLSGFDSKPDSVRVPLSDTATYEVVTSVRTIAEAFNSDDFRLYLAGTPYMTESIKEAMKADMRRFLALSILIIGACLFAMFRKLSGVLLPMLLVVGTLLSTLGLMGHLGVPVKVTTTILPSFLLSVGVGAAVHILSNFYMRLRETGEQRGAIIHALGHSGLAIVMTCLTTAVGLGSFAFAEVRPVADLGAFSSFGVLLSMAYTIVLLPALLAVIPIRPHRATAKRQPAIDRLLDWVTDFSTGNARAVVAVSVGVIVVFLGFASQLRFSHNPLLWLPADWAVREATEKIDAELRGTVALEVVVDTGRENGLYDRAILVKLDRLAREIEQMRRGELFVGKATSVSDMLMEIHQALNGNRPGSRVIPDDPRLIPQEFLLFENSGSDDLEKVVDSQFRVARFTIRVPWQDTLVYMPFVAEIEQRFRSILGPGVAVSTTGVISLFSETLNAAIRSTANSYIIAFGVITLMMILLIGDLRLGLVSMLPNLAPIVVAVGLMWITAIPLNLFTMLVGSVAIGLAVDDTIHFMHNFRRYFARTGDARLAVRRTLHTAGRAMLVTSIVLGAGLYILMFATLNNTVEFGFLTGTAIVLALVADFVLAPALMVLMNPGRAEDRPPVPVLEGQR